MTYVRIWGGLADGVCIKTKPGEKASRGKESLTLHFCWCWWRWVLPCP